MGAINTLDVLPDKWREVEAYRTRKYGAESLKNLRAKKVMFETCGACQGLRWTILEGYYDDFVLCYCIFDNKCIKQYPHRIDNKEFT